MERTDDGEGTTDGRADHWHPAGARDRREVRRSVSQAWDVGGHIQCPEGEVRRHGDVRGGAAEGAGRRAGSIHPRSDPPDAGRPGRPPPQKGANTGTPTSAAIIDAARCRFDTEPVCRLRHSHRQRASRKATWQGQGQEGRVSSGRLPPLRSSCP